jgi:hypothetical protein
MSQCLNIVLGCRLRGHWLARDQIFSCLLSGLQVSGQNECIPLRRESNLYSITGLLEPKYMRGTRPKRTLKRVSNPNRSTHCCDTAACETSFKVDFLPNTKTRVGREQSLTMEFYFL